MKSSDKRTIFIIDSDYTRVSYYQYNYNSKKDDNEDIKPKIVRTFSGLSVDYADSEPDADGHHLITDVSEFLSLIEILRGYSHNRLNKDKQYNSKSFIAKPSQQKSNNANIFTLMIKFTANNRTIYLDKIYCAILVAQFTKAMSQCDVWGNQHNVRIEHNLEIQNAKR